jgi:hypothetical protein
MSINRFHSDSTYQMNINNTTFSGAVLSATAFPYTGPENTGYVLRVGTASGDDTGFTPYLMVKAANGNVGIGTSSPLGAKLYTEGNVVAYSFQSTSGTSITNQGAYMMWNAGIWAGQGRTSFINQEGGGFGGFHWLNYGSSNQFISNCAYLSRTGGLSLSSYSNVFTADGLLVPGSVGIGTSSPQAPLHTMCNTSVAAPIARFENLNTTTTTAKSFYLQFYGNGAGGQKDVGAITMIPTDGNFGYSAMAFSVRGPFGAGSSEAVAEVMRFSRSGTTPTVSIGTTNSSAPLHISGIVAANINAYNYYNYTFPQAGVYTVILEYNQFSDTNICDGWNVTICNGSNNPTIYKISGNGAYLRTNVVSQYVVGFGSASSLPAGFNTSNYNLRIALLCAQ